tara:strand:+ start:445 stop:735 length:291 start_codon:yes stop_codon:yes gene_type:complete
MPRITVNKIEKKEYSNLIHAGKYIISLPTNVEIIKGDKLVINVHDEQEDISDCSIKLYGQVFRTFEDHCLMSVGGFLCKIPHPYACNTFLNISIKK